MRSRPPRLAPPGDRDFDGIPAPLDIDDDGDLVLDNVDRSPVGRTSHPARHVGPDGFGVHSYMALTLDQTVNANAAAVTDAQVDAAVSSHSLLTLIFRLGDPAELASAELDCGRPQSPTNPRGGGLVYCSTGGTGRVLKPGGSPTDFLEFPECCDSDGDGLGTLQPNPGSSNAMNLIHGATTAQIGTGDVLIERVNTGALDPPPDSVQYIFATVPALVSYSDGQGNSATLSYPVTGPATTAFTVAAGPNGDVIVTLTFWRPQRRPIGTGPNKEACLKDSPPCEWIDIGHLEYGVAPSPRDGCPQSTLSTSDPSLTPAPPAPSGASGFTDLADDRPASPTNTFTYTVNLTQCLASRGLSFNPGEVQGFAFGGTSSGDSTFQLLLFKRQ